MENNSYAESGDSSPRSRDIDCENPSWDEQPSNYRVKFMCSYGGKIQPRPHDNQLTYIGGETKILAVDRNIKFSDLMNKLSSFCDSAFVFKYQLPGEDLDALISVTNDEDLEHMMAEYDRVHRISPKPPRLRLFLFLQKNLATIPKGLGSNESNPNQQWLADALNSLPIDSSVAETQNGQDFLFGLDKGAPPSPAVRLPELEIQRNLPAVKVPEVAIQGTLQAVKLHELETQGDSVVSPTISPVEIQRQIHELQRLQIANQEQAMFRKNSDEALARAFHGEYYVQEKPAQVAAPVPVSNQQAYWQEMNGGGGYTTNEHPVYLIPTSSGMYQTTTNLQQVTGPPPTGIYQTSSTVQPVTGQGYYTMQRGPPPPQPRIIARPVAETGYAQVAYDSAGRQVYYTTAPGSVMSAAGAYVRTGGVDLRQVAPLTVNPEGKVATSAAAV